MKVAIIGAGISGLSCAFELKKYGIIPTIYEKKSYIGDGLEFTVSNLRMFDSFLGTPMNYFERNYGLKIQPLNPLKEIIMFGPNSKVTIKANAGNTFYKGTDEKSLENQIYSLVNIPITFDTHVNALDIKDDFDYVVVANADCSVAKELGIFKQTFNAHSRIATVIDSFNPHSIIMWMNIHYAKQGYSYLLPYNRQKATLVLSVNNITHRELEFYWNEFLAKQELNYTIVETRDVEHNLGFVYPANVDNIYLVGNAGGFMDSFLGFGTIGGIESGILAGRSIAKGQDYNKAITPLYNKMKLLGEWRKLLNGFDNKDLDRIISFLGLPGIRHLAYKNPFYRAVYSAQVVKLYSKLIGLK